jgi:hypothetical protein
VRLLVSALLVSLLLPASGESEPCSKIPFQYRDGLIWVKVELAGKKEPLNFLLDSGASASVIDLKTAQTCKIHLEARQPVTGVNGPDIAYRVNGFKATMGGLPLPKSVLAIDLGNVSGVCDQHIDGILGFDFFRNRILRIDFSAGEVAFLKDCDPDPAKCDILPMKMSNGACCVPVRIGGNGEQWMRFDTGCDSALEWVPEGAQRKPLSGPSIGLSSRFAHFASASARIGNDCFNSVSVGIHTKQIFPGEDGLLGNGLLSKFCVTVDEPRKRVIFERVK